jgi:MFS family permease
LALILFFAVRDKGAAETTAGTGFQPLTFSELFHHLSAACRNSQLWLVGIVSGSLFMSLTVFSQEKGAAYLQIVHHLPAAQATGLASVVLIGWAVGAPIVGFCSDAIRRRQVFITVGSFFALACLAVALYVPNLSVNVLLYALFFYGFFSSMQCLTFALGRELLSRRIAGTAVSLINLLVMIAAGLVLPLLDKLLLITHGGDLACTYKVAFLVLPVSLLFGFLLSLFIKETHCKLRDY